MMTDFDDAIGKVETLYRTLTGHEPPNSEATYAPIPAERDPALHVQEQMERLTRLLGGTGRQAFTAQWAPPVSLWESRDELLICVDLPAVPRDQLEVGLQGNNLVVSGRRTPPGGEELRLVRAEHGIGPFRRVIPLPVTARTEQMNAWLKDGVLSIRIPRVTNEPQRTIAVS
jgi:HSP20 family protein